MVLLVLQRLHQEIQTQVSKNKMEKMKRFKKSDQEEKINQLHLNQSRKNYHNRIEQTNSCNLLNNNMVSVIDIKVKEDLQVQTNILKIHLKIKMQNH